MRPTTYLRRTLETEDTERMPFEREHYSAVGVPYSPLAGLPELEAHQLVNGWNLGQHKQRFVYALE